MLPSPVLAAGAEFGVSRSPVRPRSRLAIAYAVASRRNRRLPESGFIAGQRIKGHQHRWTPAAASGMPDVLDHTRKRLRLMRALGDSVLPGARFADFAACATGQPHGQGRSAPPSACSGQQSTTGREICRVVTRRKRCSSCLSPDPVRRAAEDASARAVIGRFQRVTGSASGRLCR